AAWASGPRPSVRRRPPISRICLREAGVTGDLMRDLRSRLSAALPSRPMAECLAEGLWPAPDGLGCPKAKRLGTRAYLYVRPRDDAAEDTPIMFCWRHPRLLTLTKRGQIKTWPR